MKNNRKSQFIADYSSASAFQSFVQCNLQENHSIDDAYIIFIPDDFGQFAVEYKVFYNYLSGAEWICKTRHKREPWRRSDDSYIKDCARPDLKDCLNGKRKTIEGGFATLKLPDLAKQIH